MSGASPPRLNSTNSSTHVRGRRSQLFSIVLAELGGLFLELDHVLEDRVVAVPLHIVGPAHERGVLRGAAVIMPEVEIGELDRLAERISRKQPVRFDPVHDGAGGEDLFVGVSHHCGAFPVNAIHERRRVALQADVLHLRPRAFRIRTFLGDFGEQIIREPLGWVVGDAAAVESAHVAGRAGGDEHVLRGQAVGWRFQIHQILLRRKHDAVLGLGVDFDLRMIRPEVALTAGAGQARDFHGGCVPRMAKRAVANAAVGVGFANRVAGDAAALRRGIAFQFGQRVRRALH